MLVLLLALSFAGCADKKDKDDAADGASTTQTSTGGGLVAVIKVLSNGTTASLVNGSIPVQAGIELTFDGSDSTGAVLEYAWDFGDNATGSDETETHAFAAGGLYNVTLTVTGLGNASANATVRIDVAEDLAGEPLFTAAHPFEGSITAFNVNSCMVNAGFDCNDHVIPVVAEDANGTAAVAKRVTIVLDGSGALALQMQVYWRSPEGTNLNQTGTSGQDYVLTYAGDMPAGDYVVRVRTFAGAQASYTGVVAVEYVRA
jgi:hypothetical protein